MPKPAMRISSPRFSAPVMKPTSASTGLAGLGQAGVRRDGRDQIRLVHECRPPLKRPPTQATGPSRANRLTGGQHPYADKPAIQGSFQAVVAPGLHSASGASSGNAGSRLAKKSP